MIHLFPNTVSYNRFVELSQQVILPMTMFLKMQCLGDCTGITYVDSTPIRVYKNKRIKRNKVFKDIATIGISTTGWFFGFKLHLIVNEKGEILNFVITQGNVDDRTPLNDSKFLAKIKGKLYGDNYQTISNYFDNRNTNASAESFNAKIKAFRAQFRGVRNVEFFLF